MSFSAVFAKLGRKAYITGKCKAPEVFKYYHLHDQLVFSEMPQKNFLCFWKRFPSTTEYINGVYFNVYSSAFLGTTPFDILYLCGWNLFELVQADCSRRKHVNICMYKIVFPCFCTIPSGLTMFIRKHH